MNMIQEKQVPLSANEGAGYAGGLGDSPDTALVAALVQGRLGDPFALLGPHRTGDVMSVCTFHPGAAKVNVLSATGELLAELPPVQQDGGATGLFSGPVRGLEHGDKYLLQVEWRDGQGEVVLQETEDPYSFGPLLGDLDLHLMREGRHRELASCLGARAMTVNGIAGVRFAVWAPNAQRVSVIGDFNQWDGRRHAMRIRHDAGVWELFVPRIGAGAKYQYELVGADAVLLPAKADPVARATLKDASDVSVVASSAPLRWTDDEWMSSRGRRHAPEAPLSIYELHVASWLRILEEGGRSLSWQELGDRLIPYAVGMGFTHVELLPVMEHPFGGSWGYQPLSQFAPTARFGSPEDFANFVNRCHNAGLGVILDWVPAHFPSDDHGLARFDGTALYEHADVREGFHQDWNTMIYNFGRNEVRGFLIAGALEWLERFHIDGLRVDAVASMLYRDYSRKPGEWVPNVHGGRENLEAVAFLRELNGVVAERCPGAMMIAEESTSWPGVTAPVERGGLGFSYKWNMGWMHDSLHYMQHEPIHRRHHHNEMTFSMAYAYSEHFMLPISHDEVVHGKASLLNKMPGDLSQKLANLRAYLGFMFTHPGKKLLFMGCEFGQLGEWNHDASPEWHLLDDAAHRGIQRTVRDLNRLYVKEASLHAGDADPAAFRWLVGDDQANSVFAFLRTNAQDAQNTQNTTMLVVSNMTPVPRYGYRVGLDLPGQEAGGSWSEVFNSDAAVYGGGNIGNEGSIVLEPVASHGHAFSLMLTLPPLSTVIFRKD
ncbi:1,4-alpha-glucan branching protein GlgB [Undibacterium sp. TJN25]|uniref:1,4-alpha-glucan branching protein GlgB n=1 Tax=Undibacterium sp. TJN25 TaxID=3413056 RepID=UPI003BF40719